MSASKTGNNTHDTAIAVAEGARQEAYRTGTAAAVKTADIAYFRLAIVSALANGISPNQFETALIELGTR